MRVYVPTINVSPLAKALPSIPKELAIARISHFLSSGNNNTAILTGAGVSVDSGIRAYRGRNGRYLNPNYRPIFYQELVDPTGKGHSFRQRYWARSYLGWPSVRVAQPNPTHYAIAALQHANAVQHVITQNVDGLDYKAAPSSWSTHEKEGRILELHGRLRTVSCSRGHSFSRSDFQDTISTLNPAWKKYADELEETGSQLRTNPDGDIDLRGRRFDDFVVPQCPHCLEDDVDSRPTSIIKPDVIFFGETIAPSIKGRSLNEIEACDQLLIIGTTLATYSAFRILKHALELGKPTMVLNVGPTRADGMEGVEKIEWKSGDVLREVCVMLLGQETERDPELRRLLTSGVVQPLIDGREDILPAE